jgi:hypothetical protein
MDEPVRGTDPGRGLQDSRGPLDGNVVDYYEEHHQGAAYSPQVKVPTSPAATGTAASCTVRGVNMLIRADRHRGRHVRGRDADLGGAMPKTRKKYLLVASTNLLTEYFIGREGLADEVRKTRVEAAKPTRP